MISAYAAAADGRIINHDVFGFKSTLMEWVEKQIQSPDVRMIYIHAKANSPKAEDKAVQIASKKTKKDDKKIHVHIHFSEPNEEEILKVEEPSKVIEDSRKEQEALHKEEEAKAKRLKNALRQRVNRQKRRAKSRSDGGIQGTGPT